MAYNVSPFSDQTGRGGLSLLQTTQAGGTTIAQVNVPISGAAINNPRNVSYAWNANASVGVINAILGKRSPSFSFTAYAKASWFQQALLNDLIGGTDAFLSGSTYITSTYGARIAQPVSYPRLGQGYRDILGMKCVGIEMVHTATSGLIVTFHFLAMCAFTDDQYYYTLYGDPDPVAIGGFAALAPTGYTRDAGLDYGPADITYGIVTVSGNVVTAFTPFSTAADQVDGFTLSFVRAQAQQMYDNATIWPAAVTSASVGGSLRILQGATYTNPPKNFAVRIGQVGTGVVIAPVMSLDSLNQPFGQGRSVITSDQSLVDLTGAVFSNGYPFYICAA